MPLFTSGGLGLGLVSSGLGLVTLVLVLRIWSCLHHCSADSQVMQTWTVALSLAACATITYNSAEMTEMWSERTDGRGREAVKQAVSWPSASPPRYPPSPAGEAN